MPNASNGVDKDYLFEYIIVSECEFSLLPTPISVGGGKIQGIFIQFPPRPRSGGFLYMALSEF